MIEAQDTLSSMKEYAVGMGELLGAVIMGIGVGVFGALKKKSSSIKWTHQKNQKFIVKHSQIHELLTELRITIRASRCLVFQFHNGGSFADGTSIKRFSVTHESCDSGVTSMILESQDVLLTRYMELVKTLEDSSNKILRVSALAPSAFRSGLEINSVEYFSISPLKCLDGLTPLGFVCCHWCSADELDTIEKEGISQNAIEQVIEGSVGNINNHLAYKKAEQK